jgi:hypothetical protein
MTKIKHSYYSHSTQPQEIKYFYTIEAMEQIIQLMRRNRKINLVKKLELDKV